MSIKPEEVSFVVACENGPLTAQIFATRKEAERALDSLARVPGAWRRDQIFVRGTTRRDRQTFKRMTGWAGFEPPIGRP
jgi:hypothetical protein